jgi:phosphoglycolate phosphatase-like HAD superfamily hydrolase
MSTVLFWDIDGTLLSTGGAGRHAWEGAAAALTGRPVDFSTRKTAGHTDVEIAASIAEEIGLAPTPEHVLALLRGYESRLAEVLPLRAGRVLPGVREILEHLRGRPDVVSMLLTGNTAAGARAKLTYYGLDGYFTHGAFADGAVDRPAIARRAMEIAGSVLGTPALPARSFVIGDTPRDIHCARAIGARAVAVASGTYTVADLRTHEPWWVIERLPEPAAFLERLR